MFDGGLFLVLLGVGVLFLIPRFGLPLRLISVFVFFALGTVLIAGNDVGFTTTTTVVGGSSSTESFYLIGDGDANTFNDIGTWVGWIFMAIGALTSFSFLAGYIGGRY